jgi:hypothetical protein
VMDPKSRDAANRVQISLDDPDDSTLTTEFIEGFAADAKRGRIPGPLALDSLPSYLMGFKPPILIAPPQAGGEILDLIIVKF